MTLLGVQKETYPTCVTVSRRKALIFDRKGNRKRYGCR